MGPLSSPLLAFSSAEEHATTATVVQPGGDAAGSMTALQWWGRVISACAVWAGEATAVAEASPAGLAAASPAPALSGVVVSRQREASGDAGAVTSLLLPSPSVGTPSTPGLCMIAACEWPSPAPAVALDALLLPSGCCGDVLVVRGVRRCDTQQLPR